jgi:uncharacterized protein
MDQPQGATRSVPDHGTGMVAVAWIAAGERVVVFGGDFAHAAGAERARAQSTLVMQWDDDLFSVEERGDDAPYFINHSRYPNLWMDGAFALMARRVIEVGDELVADYALWEADETFVSSWRRGCGAPQCRGIITGRDWRIPGLRLRYAGHFSPLLSKRIRASSVVP